MDATPTHPHSPFRPLTAIPSPEPRGRAPLAALVFLFLFRARQPKGILLEVELARPAVLLEVTAEYFLGFRLVDLLVPRNARERSQVVWILMSVGEPASRREDLLYIGLVRDVHSSLLASCPKYPSLWRVYPPNSHLVNSHSHLVNIHSHPSFCCGVY